MLVYFVCVHVREERERERERYMSSWLHDSGSSWLSCQEGKGREEEEEYGVRKFGGVDKKGGACGRGGLMLLMFHQLGFPAIICCTSELWTTPLFMPPPSSSLFDIFTKKKKISFLFLFSLSLAFLMFLPQRKKFFVEALRGAPEVD